MYFVTKEMNSTTVNVVVVVVIAVLVILFLVGFRSRMTMPKYLVSATGDEFFLNQDNHYWWSGMTEPMHL